MQPQFIRLVVIAVAEQAADATSSAETALSVENADDDNHDCTLSVGGLPAAWYDLRPRAVSIEAGATAPLHLVVRPPRSALGRYPFTVSARTDAAAATLGFTLVVSAGGIAHLYPGPTPLGARAGTAVTERPNALVARPAAPSPRLLVAVASLLLLLLLGGLIVAHRVVRAPVTASVPFIPPTATLHGRAITRGGQGGGATSVGAGAQGAGDSVTTPPTISGEAGTVIAAETIAAGGPPVARWARPTPSQAIPVAGAQPPRPRSVATITSPARQSSPTTQLIPGTDQQMDTPRAAEPQVTATAAANGYIAARPPATRHAVPTTPIHVVVGMMRAQARTAPHARSVRLRHVTNRRAHQDHVGQRPATGSLAHPRRNRSLRPRGVQRARPQVRRRVVPTQHRAVKRGQGPRRMALPRSVHQRPQRRQATRLLSRVSRTTRDRRVQPLSVRARHAPGNSITARGVRRELQVVWPPHAVLHFDHPDVLRLTTEPGAAISVTLRIMIRGRGVDGREVAQPYHTTAYAVADRNGQADIRLRDAYVPMHPTRGTLTVVAYTAHGILEHTTPIVLRR